MLRSRIRVNRAASPIPEAPCRGTPIKPTMPPASPPLLPRCFAALPVALLVVLPAVLLLSGCARLSGFAPGNRAPLQQPASTPTVVQLQVYATSTNTPLPAATLIPSLPPTPLPTITPTPLPESGVVVSVVDGDTVNVLIGGRTVPVRYLLVEAPSLDQPLGLLAAEANRALVEGKLVDLTRDVTDVDSQGRRLRYVTLQDGTFVNGEIVRQGWAHVVAAPPNGEREDELRGIQEAAIAVGVGIWASQQGPVTRREVRLRQGPGPEFPEAEMLPTNSLLDITALSPDGQWYRVASGSWIAAFNVLNPPPTNTLQLATVPTPSDPFATLPPPTETPTITPTPTPVPTAALGSLKIDMVDKEEEYVILRNDTDEAVDLEGWKLQSEQGNQICTLSGTMEPGALLFIWAQTGPMEDFSCAFTDEVWLDLEPDAAVLWSPDGRVIWRLE